VLPRHLGRRACPSTGSGWKASDGAPIQERGLRKSLYDSLAVTAQNYVTSVRAPVLTALRYLKALLRSLPATLSKIFQLIASDSPLPAGAPESLLEKKGYRSAVSAQYTTSFPIELPNIALEHRECISTSVIMDLVNQLVSLLPFSYFRLRHALVRGVFFGPFAYTRPWWR